MSTKVYNGFYFRNAPSMDVAFQQLQACREPLRKQAFNLMVKEIVRVATFNFDKQTDLNGFGSYYSHALDFVQEELHKSKKEGRNSLYDFSFKVGMVPLLDKHHNTKKVFGYFFSSKKELISLFKENLFFVDYCYWNNADELDGVTQKEWKQRGKDWEQVTAEDSVFSEFMTIMDLVSTFDFTYRYEHNEDSSSFIPTDEERIEHLAKHLVDVDNQTEHFYPETDKLSVILNYFRSEEFLKRLENKKKEIVLIPLTDNILKNK